MTNWELIYKIISTQPLKRKTLPPTTFPNKNNLSLIYKKSDKLGINFKKSDIKQENPLIFLQTHKRQNYADRCRAAGKLFAVCAFEAFIFQK